MLLIQFLQFLAFLWLSLVALRLIQANTTGALQRALSFGLH